MEILPKKIFNLVNPSPSVTVRDIRLCYAKTNEDSFALHIDNLLIKGGTIHCIYGTNGCGKTSLLKALARVVPVSQGSLEWSNIDMPKPGKDYVFVTQAGPLPHWNVLRNVVQPQLELGVDKNEARDNALSVIGLLGLSGLEERYAHQLSAGQQQRTVLARAFALSPKILLLDEVMSGQSEYWAERIAVFLRAFADLGGMVVMVSHDPEWVMVNSDRVTHIVSLQDDAVSSTKFFCGYDGSGKEWPAFREKRLRTALGEIE